MSNLVHLKLQTDTESKKTKKAFYKKTHTLFSGTYFGSLSFARISLLHTPKVHYM